MKNWKINCDMGEGMQNDAEIMPLIDQCNIACGGHAGDIASMKKTVALAQEYQVEIGAHPSFPDRAGFGRVALKMKSSELSASLKAQVDSLKSICEQAGTKIHHIKPHGALYNNACEDQELADIIVDLMKNYPRTLLLAPWESLLAKSARKARIKVMYEAFADRKYKSDMSLVGRSDNRAIITRPEIAMSQLLSIATHDQVVPLEGEAIDIKASTFCVHSDNPNVLQILKMLNGLKE